MRRSADPLPLHACMTPVYACSISGLWSIEVQVHTLNLNMVMVGWCCSLQSQYMIYD